MLLGAAKSGRRAGCCVVCSLDESIACVLMQGKPEPTGLRIRQLFSLPLPNPDILDCPAGVQGAVPQEQGFASPGPAALPASQAQSSDISALHLLANCAEVGPLQPVTLCLHALAPAEEAADQKQALALASSAEPLRTLLCWMCASVSQSCRACSSRSSLP